MLLYMSLVFSESAAVYLAKMLCSCRDNTTLLEDTCKPLNSEMNNSRMQLIVIVYLNCSVLLVDCSVLLVCVRMLN